MTRIFPREKSSIDYILKENIFADEIGMKESSGLLTKKVYMYTYINFIAFIELVYVISVKQ